MDEQIVDEEATKVAAADDSEVTEQDLRDLKYGEDGVETSKEADEPDETKEEESESSEETEESTEEEAKTESEEKPSFVKEFPHIKGDTPEEYAKNLEVAYQNSTKEALRLKGLNEATNGEEKKETAPQLDATQLYVKQKQDEEITEAFTNFSKDYPQVTGETEYNAFTRKVKVLSQAIFAEEGRLASPKELYQTAATLLGWESTSPNSKDKLDAAVKDSAATSKTASGLKKTSKSKVTDAMIATSRAMYPDKTDAQIREELEPYV